MRFDTFVDALGGDEAGKDELKLAYKKSFKFAAKVYVVLLALTIFVAFFVFQITNDSSWPMTTSDMFAEIGLRSIFVLVWPLVLTSIVWSIALSKFSKNVRIKLPEAIAPRVELRTVVK